MNLCILDHPVKSWMESNYHSMDFDKLIIEDSLNIEVRKLYNICKNAGLEFPTVKMNKIRVLLKYDFNERYVQVIVSNLLVNFVYGLLGKEPLTGVITEPEKQLKALSKFLYQELK